MSKNVPLPGPENLGNVGDVQPGYLGPTPAVEPPPPRGERLWIDRPNQLQAAIKVLKRASVVAVDAEFTQVPPHLRRDGARSIPRLALLQMAIDHQCFVVDVLRLHDLSPLKRVVENPEISILLHGAGADLRVMAERALDVVHYYDLEATCRSIFGQNESSLAAMLQRAFHMRLDKSLQRTDWTRRPLPPAMIAYAARDAEVTLALYSWLDRNYHAILQLHEHTNHPEPVARWIEPFLHGTASASAEATVAEARMRGLIANNTQIYADCRAALKVVIHPLRRNRLLRLITDLSLVRLAPDIIPLLHAVTSDERAGSARALGRLGIKAAIEHIRPLLHDPVHDVRKAAQTALINLHDKIPGQIPPRRISDGARNWIVESSDEVSGPAYEDDWKARLRSIMDSQG